MARRAFWLACAATWHSGLSTSCPSPWQLVGEHCFWLSSSEHTFEACQRDVCAPRGATLACIRAEENLRLAWQIGLGRSKDVLAVWIGLSGAGKEGWWWVNGCTNNWTHWLRGEPDGYCGGEDCVAMAGAGGGWMDASCRLRLPCLCEYPGTATAAYNHSVPAMRDDTCYADCGDLTRWCSAWPFLRLYDVDDDVCHWEEKDGEKRGRGASECASRAEAHEDCGDYFSYAVGRCRCSPAEGVHVNCTAREPDVTSDIFVLVPGGSQLVHAGQRCAYTTIVDDDYFSSLRPATGLRELLALWFRAAAVWFAIGVPCATIMLFVTWRMCFCCHGRGLELRGSSSGGYDGVSGDAAYGPLLDTEDADAGQAVNRWIFRGAVGAIVYGFSLLALGATLAAHMAGTSTGFVAELIEAFAMALSMAAVARAAVMVHRRLSSTARDVAGPWILVLAGAKLGMALTALAGVLVFSTLADRDFENICFAEYMFRWSMLLALPLQCLAGVAFWRVQERAERYTGTGARVDGWAALLVMGNFSSGASVWWAGYLDCVHEAFIGVALFFVAAALGQLLDGVSLLLVNWKVKSYFRQQAKSQSEMAPTRIGCPDASPDSM